MSKQVSDWEREAMGEIWESKTVEEGVEGEVPGCGRGEAGGHSFVDLAVLGKRFEELRVIAWVGMRM